MVGFVVESRQDLIQAAKAMEDVDVIEDKKVLSQGRIQLGRDKAGQKPRMIITEWDQEGEEL